MNTPNKDAISKDLEQLQSHFRKTERHEKKLSTCQADIAEMQAKIQQIGKPNYKNEAAVNELATLKLRLQLCEEEAAELSDSLPAIRREFNDQLHPISVRASRLLRPLVDRRISTITAVLMPFCNSDASAMNAARATDAFQEAHMALARVAQPPRAEQNQLRHGRLLIGILEEALKKDGDLMQFLAPVSNQGKAEKPVEAASA